MRAGLRARAGGAWRRAPLLAALIALAVPASMAAGRSADSRRLPTSPHVVAAQAGTRPSAAAHGTRSPGRGIPGPAPAAAAPSGRLVAVLRPGHTVAVRSGPGGRVVARMAVTQFGSRVTFPVLARHGRWAGVPVAALGNGRLGWIDARWAGLAWQRTRKTIVIDLARRRLELRSGSRTLLAARVGIGARGTPTPRGRYAITDKLSGPAYNAAYGCCILALSGHQTNLPAGWRGGNRLAIHGTNAPAAIGAAATTGCLHATEAVLRALMRRVPLGTPVIVR